MALTEARRNQLDGLVERMVKGGESDEAIKLVVNDFKAKYGSEYLGSKNTTPKTPPFQPPKSSLKLALAGPVGQLAFKEGRDNLAEGIRLTAGNLLKPVVQFPRAAAAGIAGLFGNKEAEARFSKPVNVPILGEVKGLSAVPGDAQRYGTLNSGETLTQAGMSYLEAGAPGAGKVLKSAFTKTAEKLYQSALKPSSKAFTPEQIKQVVRTGLDERIWLTKGGVEKVASKIDDMENVLGEAIDQAKNQNVKIPTQGLEKYIDEVRDMFKYNADVAESNRSLAKLDSLVNGFKARYGKDIPIEVAQRIKVETGKLLKKEYGKLSTVSSEGQKQITRFLKDKILEKAPAVKDINQRLSRLYQFDKALQSAQTRISNLNLLGLATKVGGAVRGRPGWVLGLALDLADKPLLKSLGAFTADRISKSGTAAKAVRSTLTSALNAIRPSE